MSLEIDRSIQNNAPSLLLGVPLMEARCYSENGSHKVAHESQETPKWRTP